MKPFLDEDFLLDTPTAVELYHGVAAQQPILDYHCHLSPHQVADDHRFRSHRPRSGSRATTTSGGRCAPTASPSGRSPARRTDWEKFEAWARTVPHTLRNPLYHWTHLELRFPFGVRGKLLGPDTAREIFDHCNAKLAGDGFTTQGLLRQFDVRVVCSTDDPIDDLEPHRRHAQRRRRVHQALADLAPRSRAGARRPRRLERLARRARAPPARAPVGTLDELRDALGQAARRAFTTAGCRASDHGLERHLRAPTTPSARSAAIFAKARAGQAAVARRDREAPRGAALRPGGARSPARLGAAVPPGRAARHQHARDGGARPQHRLRRHRRLPAGDRAGAFPRPPRRRPASWPRPSSTTSTRPTTRPSPPSSAAFRTGRHPGRCSSAAPGGSSISSTACASSSTRSPAWACSSRFVGMLTDSRSFLSFSRHEYFRRLLCNMLGQDVERGLLPERSRRCWARWSRTSASATPATTSGSSSDRAEVDVETEWRRASLAATAYPGRVDVRAAEDDLHRAGAGRLNHVARRSRRPRWRCRRRRCRPSRCSSSVVGDLAGRACRGRRPPWSDR